MKKPRCCDKPMLRASSRLKVPGETRPTSRVPYRAVGWYCDYCGEIKSLKSDINVPSLLIYQTIHENTELKIVVQHTVLD